MFLHDPAVRAAYPHLHVGLLLLRRAHRLDAAAWHDLDGILPACGTRHPVAIRTAALAASACLRAAVFDLDRIDGTLLVRFATGCEPFEDNRGGWSRTRRGEVIFGDDAGRVHARDWAGRRSPHAVLSAQTRTALVVVQALRPGAGPDVRWVLDRLATPLRKAGGAVDTFDLGLQSPTTRQATEVRS